MKKIIIVSVASIFAIMTFVVMEHSESIQIVMTKAINVIKSKKQEAQLEGANPLLITSKEKEMPSLEDGEKELSSLTTEELRSAIDKNNRFVKEHHLIELANKGELNANTEAELTSAIRKNAILHKILLERQLEEYQMGSL